MEKGRLIISPTSRGGFQTILEFEKGGQTKTMPLSFLRLPNDAHNGKTCLYQRGKTGQIEVLKLEDGTMLYPVETPRSSSPTSKGNYYNNRLDTPLPTDIFDLRSARIPYNVRDLGFEYIDNFHLKLNRYAFFKETDMSGKPLDWGHKDKKFWLSEQGKKGFSKVLLPNFGILGNEEQLKKMAQRLQKAAEHLCGKLENLYTLDAPLHSKLALGLGHESVYENGLTLHHIYGIPYIPASSVKGIVRSYIIQTKFDNKEENAIQDKSFCDLFGCPDKIEKTASAHGKAHEGKAFFFDAFPITTPIVEPDIMNPHYGDYYGSWPSKDKKNKGTDIVPPLDTGNPVPIHFMIVRDTVFQFLIGSKLGNIDLQKGKLEGKILDVLSEILPKALSEHGLGAKTAVGYGYFKETQ